MASLDDQIIQDQNKDTKFFKTKLWRKVKGKCSNIGKLGKVAETYKKIKKTNHRRLHVPKSIYDQEYRYHKDEDPLRNIEDRKFYKKTKKVYRRPVKNEYERNFSCKRLYTGGPLGIKPSKVTKRKPYKRSQIVKIQSYVRRWLLVRSRQSFLLVKKTARVGVPKRTQT